MNKFVKVSLAVASLVALSACHCHHHGMSHYRGGYHAVPSVKHHVVHHKPVHKPHGHFHR